LIIIKLKNIIFFSGSRKKIPLAGKSRKVNKKFLKTLAEKREKQALFLTLIIIYTIFRYL
jgi:hypothetical protein